MLYIILIIFTACIQLYVYNYAMKNFEKHDRFYVERQARAFSSFWSLIVFIFLIVILSLFSGSWVSISPFAELNGMLKKFIKPPQERAELKSIYLAIQFFLTGLLPCLIYMYINAYITTFLIEKLSWKKTKE